MNRAPRGRPPTHLLYITERVNTKKRTKAGALFENDFGGYNLVLGPGITITDKDSDIYWFQFKPYEVREEVANKKESGDDEEIPFR